LLGREIGGIKFGVRDSIDFAVDNVGHVGGAAFDVFGVFSGEVGIDDFFEKREPMVELLFTHLGEGGQFGVGGERVALVAAGSEEDGFPKRIHFREVGFPVHFGDLLENEAEGLVFSDDIVEGIDEEFDASAVEKIRESGFHNQVVSGMG